jgi:vancomycin resistance protein VanJ
MTSESDAKERVKDETPGCWVLALRGVSWAYLGGLVVLWAWTRGVAEESSEAIALLYAPQAVYGAPLLLLVPWSALRREPAALVAQGLALGVLLGPLMGLCLPLASGWISHPHAPRLRVMTYNIHVARLGRDWIRGEVRAARPDLLLLDEAYNEHRDEPLYDWLAQDLPGYSVYQRSEYYLASRYPLVGPHLVMSQTRTSHWVEAEVEAPFGRFPVVGLHLAKDRVFAPVWSLLYRRAPGEEEAGFADARAREAAVKEILRAHPPSAGPLLLMGDFNTPPAGRIYGALAADLQDAYAEAGCGWGYTFPARLPLVRIDYLFARRPWQPARAWVGGRRGSHHRALVADLDYAGGEEAVREGR